MNGVINIVTKNAVRTQGALVSTSSDWDNGYTAVVQYGGQITSKVNYRVFGKASYWEPFASPAGGDVPSAFSLFQGGARLDWAASSKDAITLEGGAYDGRFGHFQYLTTLTATYLLKGNHVLARWQHTISSHSSTETMAYCDWYSRYSTGAEDRNTCDLEFQHSYEFNQRHSLIWGGAFLSTGDNLAAGPTPFTPERRRNDVVSGFAQYEVAIIPRQLRVLVGSKIEHNGYTGFEYQPQARTVWSPAKSHTVWASVSRAVREPSRVNSDLDYTSPAGDSGGVPVFVQIRGNPNLESEHLFAYESGYRFQRTQSISFDLAAYYNQYTNLIALSPMVPEVLPTGILLQSHETNDARAQTHGAEFSAQWKPIHSWKVSAAVTETRGSLYAMVATPKHLFNAQSRIDLPHKVQFDTAFYRYGSVPIGQTFDVSTLPPQGIQAFSCVDVGATWHMRPQWAFAVWGRNLQSDGHVETKDTIFLERAAYVPRSVLFKLMWQSKPEGK